MLGVSGTPQASLRRLRAGSARHGLRESGIVQQRPHAAQRIDTLPRPSTCALLRKEPLGGVAVDVPLRLR